MNAHETMRELMAQVPQFAELGAGALLAPGVSWSVLNAARGEVLFRRGESCRGAYWMVRGQVKCYVPLADGREKVLEVAGPGKCLFDMVCFENRQHLLSAEALCASQLAFIPRSALQSGIERSPAFARALIAMFSARSGDLLCELENCTLPTGTQRVVRYLLRHLPERANGAAVKFTLPIHKGLIASQLNLTQEHFSRILRDLAADGRIHMDGRRITIPDLERLRALNA